MKYKFKDINNKIEFYKSRSQNALPIVVLYCVMIPAFFIGAFQLNMPVLAYMGFLFGAGGVFIAFYFVWYSTKLEKLYILKDIQENKGKK